MDMHVWDLVGMSSISRVLSVVSKLSAIRATYYSFGPQEEA
jgi:hypothetical protein